MPNRLGSHKGGAPRKYGKEARQRMRELYQLGIKSSRRIAFVIGCSHETVRREFGQSSTD